MELENLSNKIDILKEEKKFDILFTPEIDKKIKYILENLSINREKIEKSMEREELLNEGEYLSHMNRLLNIFKKTENVQKFIKKIFLKYPFLSGLIDVNNIKNIEFVKEPILNKEKYIEDDFNFLVDLLNQYGNINKNKIIIFCQLYDLIMKNFKYINNKSKIYLKIIYFILNFMKIFSKIYLLITH